MPDRPHRVDTAKPCPLCGHSDVDERPTRCRLCDGYGLVDRSTWERWKDRPPARATSTSIDMHAIAIGRLAELRNVLGERGAAFVKRGEGLVAVIESWKEVPADGRERTDHYQQVVAWLEESATAMRGVRRFK